MTYEGDLIEHYREVRYRILRGKPPSPLKLVRPSEPPSTPLKPPSAIERMREERLIASWAVPEPAPWDYCPDEMPMPAYDWRNILKQVCEKHGISAKAVTGPTRTKETTSARHEAFYRLREERQLTWHQIGRLMGGFDHTSVLYGYRKHQRKIAADGSFPHCQH